MSFVKTIPESDLPEGSHKRVALGRKQIALFHYDGKISALGNTCLHKGGDLGLGFIQKLDDGELYVACPWHGWQYHIRTGLAPRGYGDQQAVYDVRIEDGHILVSEQPVTKARKAAHKEDPLADLRNLEYRTTSDSLNILGISSSNMNDDLPRMSTSETALKDALTFASAEYGAATQCVELRKLLFRHCEGYYSRHEAACTWPCSISEMDPDDGMTELYRAMVLWADVVIFATPIRWGNASSLYYKMAERLNCVQNQITLFDKVLIQNKVASFIITGGQDNIQQVAGQLTTFFTDLGFMFPPFSFVGWSRGWTAEDMEENTAAFRRSRYIKRSVRELVKNSVMLLRQVKGMDCSMLRTPKPSIREAASRQNDPGSSDQ